MLMVSCLSSPSVNEFWCLSWCENLFSISLRGRKVHYELEFSGVFGLPRSNSQKTRSNVIQLKHF
jgi:hypothetical protein